MRICSAGTDLCFCKRSVLYVGCNKKVAFYFWFIRKDSQKFKHFVLKMDGEEEINVVEIPRLNIQWDWRDALRWVEIKVKRSLLSCINWSSIGTEISFNALQNK